MFGYTVSRTVETSEASTQTEDYRYGADFNMTAATAIKPTPLTDEQGILVALLVVLGGVIHTMFG